MPSPILGPINWSLKIRAFQSLIISKVAYGWIGQNPPRDIVETMFTKLSSMLATGKGTARELRKMFYGTVSYLPIVALTRQWGRMHRIRT